MKNPVENMVLHDDDSVHGLFVKYKDTTTGKGVQCVWFKRCGIWMWTNHFFRTAKVEPNEDVISALESFVNESKYLSNTESFY